MFDAGGTVVVLLYGCRNVDVNLMDMTVYKELVGGRWKKEKKDMERVL